MPRNAIDVRLRQPTDDQAIVELLAAAFDGWPAVETDVSPVDHLRWKVASRADAGRYHLVAEIGARIVGVQFHILQDVKVGTEVLRAAQGVDFCVHPDYRRQGVRGAMFEAGQPAMTRDIALVFSLQGGHPGMKKFMEPSISGRRYLANEIQTLVCKQPMLSVPMDQPAISIRSVPAFDGRIDAFLAEASRPFQLIVMRNRAYLNWRYADRRAGSYTILLAAEGTAVLGYAVARTSRGIGYIADLLALPGRLDVVSALLGQALASPTLRSAQRIECWSPVHHPYRGVLNELGFVEKRRTVPLRVVPRGERSDPVVFRDDPRAAIHVLAGDTDLA